MIYVVEDDVNIRELILYALKNTGFEVEGFENGRSFFTAVSRHIPELLLLDIMLPGEDGVTILKKLRASEETKVLPIILVTAKGSEYDRVTGLDNGADDYVCKPFGMMELVSRVKALLRRSKNLNKGESRRELIAGDITVNTAKHTVTACGSEVTLTYKEFELLCLLIENKGLVLTRDNILEIVWGYDFDGETRTVDVHIRTLRQKLGMCGELIQTIRGIGYRIGV